MNVIVLNGNLLDFHEESFGVLPDDSVDEGIGHGFAQA